MNRVLFVCLGNICRSPTAEGVFRHLVRAQGASDSFEIDSAGTGAWHTGEAPDARMRAAAADVGYQLEGSARAVENADFHRFDLILAMDASNLDSLQARAPSGASATIRMFRDFDPKGPGDVPDPYYGGPEGFREVVRLVERTSAQLLADLCTPKP